MKYIYSFLLIASLALPQIAFAIDPPAITANQQLCAPGGTVTLTATAPGGGTYSWYNALTGGTLLFTGAAYSIPSVTTTTTLYAEVTLNGETSVRTPYTVAVNPPPTAAFTAPATIDCASQAYSFINTSTGNNLTYSWNFGNPASGSSNTSALQHPSHVFVPNPGTGIQQFTVSLTVTDALTSCSSTITHTVNVHQTPDASFNVNSSSAFFSQGVFINCDATITSPSFVFTIANGSSTAASNTNYLINWGDGTTDSLGATFTNATHTYATLGFFNITLSVQNSVTGCTAMKVYQFFNGNSPGGNLGGIANTSGCSPYTLTWPVENTQDNTPGTIYTFSVNDGSPSQSFTQENLPPAISHTFTQSSCNLAAGKYTVTLTIDNPCSSIAPTTQVQASLKAEAAFSVSQANICTNTPIIFTNTSVGNYFVGNNCSTVFNKVWTITPSTGWTLTSGQLAGTEAIGVQFNTPGNYTVSLNISKPGSNNSCTEDSITQPICVKAPLTTPVFALSNTAGCAPFAVIATAPTVPNPCNSVMTYAWAVTYTNTNCGTTGTPVWNYASGTSATSANPQFNFVTPGTYSIRLTMNNGCGAVQSALQTVTVKNPPTVTIAAISSICGGASASINPTATVSDCGAAPLTYVWSFPGGVPATSSAAVPGAIAYSTPGSYTVTLAVTNECGTTTHTRTFSVSPAVLANAGSDVTICNGPTTLTGLGSGGNGGPFTYSWSPAAGLSNSAIASPIATPTATTTYTLTVTNGGCTATDQVTVYINNLTPGTIASNQVLCASADPVAFTVSTPAAGQGVLTYQWESSVTSATAGYTDIAGATSDIYDAPVLSQQMWFRRKVISTLNGVTCTATSNAINIAINTITAGSISGNQNICSGGDPAAFGSIAAAGNGTISYQWQSSSDNNTFTNIPGATSAIYNPPALTANTWYRRVDTSTLSGIGCSQDTNTITITLTTPPDVTVQPLASQTLCAAATPQSLTVQATGGTIPYTYQWYSNTTNTTIGGTAVTGATSDTFTPPTTTVGTRYYYCVVSSPEAGCTDTSATAQVTVIAAPIISSQPQPQTLCEGQIPAPLTADYQNGTGTPTFQWYSNTTASNTGGTVIGGETTATYLPAATVGVNYYYAVITFPTGGCNSITSNAAAITISSLPAVTTTQAQTICSGTSFDVTPTNTGGNNLPVGTLYRWTAPTGTGFTGGSQQTTPVAAISQILTNTTNAAVTVTYSITPVSNGCNGTPFQAVITINPKPVIPAQTRTICSGDSFTVTPANAGSIIVPSGTTYSWQAPVATGGVTGGLAGNAAADISGTLINPTNVPQIVTYTVTPVAPTGNCIGSDFTVIVTVNPRLAITAMSGNACSGSTFTFTPVNGTDGIVPAGTQYTWAAPSPQTGITGLASGSGTSVTGSLTNNTTSPVTIQYTVIPMSGSCSGNIFTVDVIINPTPTVASIAYQTVCNGSATTAVAYSGTITGTQFNWTNNTPSIGLATSGTGNIPSFNAVNSGTAPVTATITVTPVLNSCNGTPIIFTITVNPAPVVIFSTANQAICSGTASTAVALTSATPNTTISWTAVVPSGITGVQTSGTTAIPTQTLVNTTSSPITVTYTAVATTSDASACPGAPSNYTVTVNPVPFVNATQQTVVCSGVPLNFVPADGNGNNIPTGTTFTWAAPTGTGFTGGSAQTTAQPSLNQTLVNTTVNPVVATYTVTPKFGGCTGVPFTVQVTVNPTAMIPNASITLCSSGTFSFNPVPTATLFPAGTVFNWSAPSGNVTGGAAGTGQTLINGSLANTTSIVQNAVYTITPVSPTGNCAGNPFTLTVAVNPTFSVTSTISNYNGFQISSAGANDGFINLTPSGGTGSYTYAWTGPGTFASTSQNVNNLGQGDYTVVINDGLCPAITLQFHIAEPLPLVIQEVIASHVNVDCFGQSTGVIEVAITQASIAPFDYALLLADGTVVENVLDITPLNYVFDNLPAGTYNIRVTDANGIMKFVNGVVISQPATGLAISNAVVSNFNGFSISCNGEHNGSINLTVTGGYPGYTYAWTGPSFTASTQDISNLNPGVYTVVINDTTNSCPITQSFTITEPQPVAFSGVISDFNGFGVSCFDGNNGSITVTPTGGTSVYTYAWTGPGTFTATTQNLTGIKAGTYQLTLIDSNGCVAAVQSFALTQPGALTISEQHSNILCFGDATGTIDITVGGGLPDSSGTYAYTWSGPNGFSSSSEDLTNIAAGTYNLVVTDSNGCTIPLVVTLTQQPEIIITPSTTPISCYGANDASITLAITGGDPPYTAQWSNLAAGTFQDNLAAGNYVITVTDGSGCVKQANVVIPEAPIFTVNPVFNHVSCNGAHDGSITLNLVGGIAPVSLIWSDGSTAGTQRNNLGPGTYTVTITDGKPCQIERTFTIVEPAKLTIGSNITHALDCDDTMSGAIDLLVAGGMPPYSYTWSNGATTEDLTAITSGTYLVTVSDTNNCTVNGTYIITRPEPITLNVTSNVSFNCDTKQVTQVNTAQASGGVPPFQYTWSSGTVSGNAGQSMTTNQNGTVIVTATDAAGCKGTQSFTVDTQRLGNAKFTAESYASVTYNVFSIFDPVQFTNLSTSDYTDLAWDFGDGAVSDEENPTHTYVREGTYIVTLTVVYPYGCVDVEKLTLIITKGYDVMVPNAFTPNGDGTNDTFNAVHKGLKAITLNIYDTWGSVIYYEKGDVIRGWDGTIKGVSSENGNYYYRIEAETFYGQTVSYEGALVLIK